MADAKVKDLTKRRGIVKAKLTIFNSFINMIKDCQNVNDAQSLELKYRLDKFESLYSEFDQFQKELELLSEQPETLFAEREQFENQYYSLLGISRELLNRHSTEYAQNLSEVGSVDDRTIVTQKPNFVKLPKIDLPNFSGCYHDWLEFRDTFISLIHVNGNIDAINKFHYLRASLRGAAALVIKALDFKADNYQSAWSLLCARYDNKRLLVNNHVQSLFNVEGIHKESSGGLRNLIDTTNKNLRALSTLDQPVEHWDTLIIHMMSSKLDSITNREWEEHRNNMSDPPTLTNFITFVSNRADLLETLEEAKNNKIKQDTTSTNKPKSFIITQSKSRTPSCPLCTGDHVLFSCQSFRDLPVQIRIQKAKEFKVCMNCLRVGHIDTTCRLGPCNYCNIKHNTLLHVDKPEPTLHHDNVALSVQPASQSHVLLSTAIVKVLDKNGKTHAARLLLDNGSTANFITQSLCGKLNLHTRAVDSKVTGINSQISNTSQRCSLKLESYYGDYKMNIDCYVLPKITTSVPTTFINTEHIQIPSYINLADPSFNIPSSIDILVGADIFWSVIGTKRISLGRKMPRLFETKLGWLISGAICQNKPTTQLCMFTQESQTQNIDISRFWELDTIPIKHNFSSEENACERNFIDTTERDSNGRFIVTIPLKESPAVLGNSFDMAKSRFLALERRLDKNPSLKLMYDEFIKEYIQCGHMSENRIKNQLKQVSYYMPHHGVLRESSTTTKLRVVFDASAVTIGGKSFNNIQMVGPTIQDDLMTILLRFRQHKYVVSGDIEKMYRQIKIKSDQRSLQQILWRFDSAEPLKTYTLNTVTYGTASAPFLATRCLTQLAYDSSDKIIQRAIAHDFYVDDFLSGSDTISDTVNICKGVIATLESAKFNLRKWKSNSTVILQSINSSNDAPHDILDLGANELCKTLGINWRCNEDTFSFSINISPPSKLTKRHILSTIAQVFDPLGLVSPCIVEAKILIQKLWRLKCDWDEEIPTEYQNMWNQFEITLPYLNNLQISRRTVCDFPVLIELHIFTDASENAYGACIYVRSISNSGEIDVHFLVSKSKVAPIKSTTIPRLELCGALIGARLCAKVLNSFTCRLSTCIFWSDSTVVLGWLSSSPSQPQPFIRNRVNEIQESTKDFKWRYVPSKLNPADLVSRGQNANMIKDSSLWWVGPPFLKQDELLWPKAPNADIHSNLPDSTHSLIVNTSTNIDHNLISTLISEISDFSRLQRIVVYILRFVNNCRNDIKLLNFITTIELKNALKLILRVAQLESFSDEYNLLKKQKSLPSKNRLLSLSPFIDSDNLIRVGGRLNNSHYDYNVKHPILLCSKNKLCQLIFIMFHKKLLHAGPQLLLASIKQVYWPLGGRNLAKRTVHSCITCCRFKGQTVQPIMGNLPEQRVHLEFPFLETGVDYAGPIMIANRKGRGCKLVKSYICVFVCLATKAVHLELVSDLTKEAFVAALNRFTARRGKPTTIYSDNGTTFVGTFNELSNLLKTNPLSDITEQGIEFSFIPAYTPHFGGIWESAVKSIKHHLRRILGLTHLNYEEMSTCLIQIEAILNSRPLTPISDDPSDLVPLTPAHFLIGRSLMFAPHPEITTTNVNSLQRFQRIEFIKQHFWKRFTHDYILTLQQKTKWCRPMAN